MRVVLLALTAAALIVAENTADWKITLEPKAEMKAQRPVPVEISLTDAKGAPVAGADVELVLTMVDMDHGETKVAARQVRSGVYEAKPKFLMDGKWNIEVRARKGSTSASMKQHVEVEE